jgi:hypothetical protein
VPKIKLGKKGFLAEVDIEKKDIITTQNVIPEITAVA